MNNMKMMPGTPCHASDEETTRSIRAILTEGNPIEDRAPNLLRRAFSDRAPQRVETLRRRETDLPDLEPQSAIEDEFGATPSWVPQVGAVKARHVAYLAAVACAVMVPQVFVFVLIAAPLVALALFLALGPTRLGHRHLARIAQIEERDPKQAKQMRQRMDRFACIWDMVLDRLPAGLADRLALPDAASSRPSADQWHDYAVAGRAGR